jgi:TetR/AcrR family transcriptional regulator, regulator of autoinduction and epiphytic fitness
VPHEPDGRELRTIRTRTAIIRALVELVEETDVVPRARDVADRAGVALRTVFVHFADLEQLYAGAAAYQVERMAAIQVPIPTTDTLLDRVSALAKQRRTVWETIGPIRRNAIRRESESALLTQFLADQALQQKAVVEELFAVELAAAAAVNSQARVLAGMDTLLSFGGWEHLRRRLGLSADDAEQVVAETCFALLLAAQAAMGQPMSDHFSEGSGTLAADARR